MSDTKVFGGAPDGKPQSVFRTAVQSGPFSLAGRSAAFGGMRNQTQKDDDEDEEEPRETGVFSSGSQSLQLTEGAVTYDQVSPIFEF